MQSRQFSRVRRTRKVSAGVLTHGKDIWRRTSRSDGLDCLHYFLELLFIQELHPGSSSGRILLRRKRFRYWNVLRRTFRGWVLLLLRRAWLRRRSLKDMEVPGRWVLRQGLWGLHRWVLRFLKFCIPLLLFTRYYPARCFSMNMLKSHEHCFILLFCKFYRYVP